MFDGGPLDVVAGCIGGPRYGIGFGGITGSLEVFGIGDGKFMPRAVEEAETEMFTAAGAPLVGWVGRFLLVVDAGGTGLTELLVFCIDVGRGPASWEVANLSPRGPDIVGRSRIDAGPDG